MSAEQLQAFISKIQSQPQLKKRLQAAELEESDLQAILSIAKEQGFMVTAEDVSNLDMNIFD